MQVKMSEELESWCYYNIKEFKMKLKDGAPEYIKNEYKRYYDKFLDDYYI